MRVDNFAVNIPDGIEGGEGYIELPHGTQYRIQLQSYDNRKADAEIKVDGKVVGIIRVDPYQTVTIERPTHDKGKFTFYLDGTTEAQKAGLNKVKKSERGLISITFKPEKKAILTTYPVCTASPDFYDPPVTYGFDNCIGSSEVDSGYKSGGPRGMCASPGGQHVNSTRYHKEYSAGGTGLSGKSRQNYYTVAALDYDQSAFVTVNLRLVGITNEPRPLTEVPTTRSNPIPRPV